MHVFDRQTDGQTEISSLDRVCIPCSAVKKLLDPDPEADEADDLQELVSFSLTSDT